MKTLVGNMVDVTGEHDRTENKVRMTFISLWPNGNTFTFLHKQCILCGRANVKHVQNKQHVPENTIATDNQHNVPSRVLNPQSSRKQLT